MKQSMKQFICIALLCLGFMTVFATGASPPGMGLEPKSDYSIVMDNDNGIVEMAIQCTDAISVDAVIIYCENHTIFVEAKAGKLCTSYRPDSYKQYVVNNLDGITRDVRPCTNCATGFLRCSQAVNQI